MTDRTMEPSDDPRPDLAPDVWPNPGPDLDRYPSAVIRSRRSRAPLPPPSLPAAALGRLADNALPVGVLAVLLIAPPHIARIVCTYGFGICGNLYAGQPATGLWGLASQAVGALFRLQFWSIIGIAWRAAVIAMFFAVLARAWRGLPRFDPAADVRTAQGGLARTVVLRLAMVLLLVQLPFMAMWVFFEAASDLVSPMDWTAIDRYFYTVGAVLSILAPLELFWQAGIALDRQSLARGMSVAIRRLADMPGPALLLLVLELAKPGVLSNLSYTAGVTSPNPYGRSDSPADWVVIAALTAYQYVVVVGAWTDRGSDAPDGERAEAVRGVRKPRPVRLRAWRRRTSGG